MGSSGSRIHLLTEPSQDLTVPVAITVFVPGYSCGTAPALHRTSPSRRCPRRYWLTLCSATTPAIAGALRPQESKLRAHAPPHLHQVQSRRPRCPMGHSPHRLQTPLQGPGGRNESGRPSDPGDSYVQTLDSQPVDAYLPLPVLPAILADGRPTTIDRRPATGPQPEPAYQHQLT